MTNLVHQHIGKQLCFHLAMDGLSKEDEERLNRSVLLRVLLPQFLPRQLKRVIYMDVDMLARESMEPL